MKAMPLVKESRRETDDAYSFNWSIRITPDLQMPFDPTHENMANLKLYPDQPVEMLAADLRRAFSGIVAGNVKEVGIRAIEKIRSPQAARRSADDASDGRPAAGLRRPAPHEASGRHCVYSLLRNLFLIANLSFRVTARAVVIRSLPVLTSFNLL